MKKRSNGLEGFDLGPVLDWLEANLSEIKKRLDWFTGPNIARFPVKVIDPKYLQLGFSGLEHILSRFPPAACERSTLEQLRGMPETWFKNTTKVNKPMITTEQSEALAPRAFVPGYTRVIKWTPEEMTQEIRLYKIPGVLPEVARFMAAHSLIHEFAHTLINPIWYNFENPYTMSIPGQGLSNGRQFLYKFAMMASRYPAISHYSAAYRPIPADPKDKRFLIRMSEELCECVVAYILGYIYCDDESRCMDPFRDRNEIKEMVRDFLNAKLVK